MIIEPHHFEYLVIQRGEVSDHRHEFAAWKKAYQKSLMEIFSSIHPVLPARCRSVLDIGGGLGGVDLHLVAHYGADTEIVVLDGLDCPPRVVLHCEPFNNAEVTIDFHKKNGNDNIEVVFPAPNPPRKFDLIVSFAAYCFHIPPSEYMEVVKQSMHEDTVLIFDVRRMLRHYVEQLIVEFGKPIVLKKTDKLVRLAFRCAPSLSSVAVGQ